MIREKLISSFLFTTLSSRTSVLKMYLIFGYHLTALWVVNTLYSFIYCFKHFHCVCLVCFPTCFNKLFYELWGNPVGATLKTDNWGEGEPDAERKKNNLSLKVHLQTKNNEEI